MRYSLKLSFSLCLVLTMTTVVEASLITSSDLSTVENGDWVLMNNGIVYVNITRYNDNWCMDEWAVWDGDSWVVMAERPSNGRFYRALKDSGGTWYDTGSYSNELSILLNTTDSACVQISLLDPASRIQHRTNISLNSNEAFFTINESMWVTSDTQYQAFNVVNSLFITQTFSDMSKYHIWGYGSNYGGYEVPKDLGSDIDNNLSLVYLVNKTSHNVSLIPVCDADSPAPGWSEFHFSGIGDRTDNLLEKNDTQYFDFIVAMRNGTVVEQAGYVFEKFYNSSIDTKYRCHPTNMSAYAEDYIKRRSHVVNGFSFVKDAVSKGISSSVTGYQNSTTLGWDRYFVFVPMFYYEQNNVSEGDKYLSSILLYDGTGFFGGTLWHNYIDSGGTLTYGSPAGGSESGILTHNQALIDYVLLTYVNQTGNQTLKDRIYDNVTANLNFYISKQESDGRVPVRVDSSGNTIDDGDYLRAQTMLIAAWSKYYQIYGNSTYLNAAKKLENHLYNKYLKYHWYQGGDWGYPPENSELSTPYTPGFVVLDYVELYKATGNQTYKERASTSLNDSLVEFQFRDLNMSKYSTTSSVGGAMKDNTGGFGGGVNSRNDGGWSGHTRGDCWFGFTVYQDEFSDEISKRMIDAIIGWMTYHQYISPYDEINKGGFGCHFARVYDSSLAGDSDGTVLGHTFVAQALLMKYYSGIYFNVTTQINAGETTEKYYYSESPVGQNKVDMSINVSHGHVNVTLVSWDTENKKWIENASSSDITTNHTLWNLTPNCLYEIKVDGVVFDTVQTNDEGVLSFLYDGGYSEKTFEVSETSSTSDHDYIPPDPTNLHHTISGVWVYYTWQAGTGNVTDSYNVSLNGVWTNGTTDNYMNCNVGYDSWANITVWAFNASGNGTLSIGSISDAVKTGSAPSYSDHLSGGWDNPWDPKLNEDIVSGAEVWEKADIMVVAVTIVCFSIVLFALRRWL